MFYEYSLTIPADTPITDPVSIQAKLVQGVIESVAVQFWAGQRGNVHVRILEKTHQLWPTNLEGWLTADNHVIQFKEQYNLQDVPFTLDIQGYNEDENYEHEIRVRFSVSVGQWTLEDLANLLAGPIEVIG